MRLKTATPEGWEAMREVARIGKRIVRALRDAGARILAGTDATNPFVVPGFSLHEELRLLVESGLTPYEALRTATAAPAEFLEDGAGVVAEGAPADLLLLERDPLEDVAHARAPAGVMARGQWLARPELEHMLEDVAGRYVA
jgi:imidazolonepropionase-like amidohydrolase